jgi:REP element-mobilizing transposase RayT
VGDLGQNGFDFCRLGRSIVWCCLAECGKLNCHILALNGVENHVHLLVSQPATLSVAHLAKQIKGSTSFFVNKRHLFDGHFQWQHDYAAFSVSRWDRTKIIAYIERQKEHHANGTTLARLELPRWS